MAADNKTLGRFILDGIPAAPRGIPQIEVTFDIDANGILKVAAKDKGTGKEQKITIENATNLSDEEVEKMKAEAEKHADEDKQKKELVESRNAASSAVFELEKQLTEHGDKLDKKDKEAIEEQVKKLKELSTKEEASSEDLKKATQETLKAAQKLGEIVYQKTQAQGPESVKGEEAKKSDAKANQANSKKDAKASAEEGEVVDE
jgi:molecular chaperone DnaK